MKLTKNAIKRVSRYMRGFERWDPLRATLRTVRNASRLLRDGTLKNYFRYRLHKPPTIVVIGMHRSGTSFTTRAINLLGANVGGNLVGSDSSNTAGHWEHKYSLDINKSILNISGGRWDKPPEKVESELFLRLRMKFFLSKIYDEDGKAVVWKDPRTALTFPVWKREMVNYVPVFVFRNPLSVASSLQKRNGFTKEKGLKLWLEYNRRIIDIDEDEKTSFFINFDGGMEHISMVLKEISRETNLCFDKKVTNSYKEKMRSSDESGKLDGKIKSTYRKLKSNHRTSQTQK